MQAPLPGERRQPTFRSFAALGLLFTLSVGLAALTLAGLMVLRKLTKFAFSQLDLPEIHIQWVSDSATWFVTQMTTSTIAFLATMGLTLLGVAMIFRRIVLAGLRD